MRTARASERDSHGRAAGWAIGLVLACATGDAAAAAGLEVESAGRSMLGGDEVASTSVEATAEAAATPGPAVQAVRDPRWVYGAGCLVVAAVAALLLRRGRG